MDGEPESPESHSESLATLATLLLLLEILAGLGFVFLWRHKREGARAVQTVPVVVAGRDLPAGTVLTYEMFARRPLAESLVTPARANDAVGRTLQVPLHKGDLLRWSDVAAGP